ncbi:MAG: hypothetical protein V3V06_04250 [Dehalococcoidia bacterium]
MVHSPAQTAAAVPVPAYPMACTILTPSGTIIARGRAAPRKRDHVAEAYSVQLTDVDPPGVLEAMVYSDQPIIVLRTESAPELRVRIDHITGPAHHREFYCHLS